MKEIILIGLVIFGVIIFICCYSYLIGFKSDVELFEEELIKRQEWLNSIPKEGIAVGENSIIYGKKEIDINSVALGFCFRERSEDNNSSLFSFKISNSSAVAFGYGYNALKVDYNSLDGFEFDCINGKLFYPKYNVVFSFVPIIKEKTSKEQLVNGVGKK